MTQSRYMTQSRDLPLKIYMGDLTHDTILLVSDTIPINIGFIASFAKKIFGDQITMTLFKYPQTIIDAIIKDPPDILALSNYSWNSNLSEQICKIAKKIKPDIITVQGGANFPHKETEQLKFLSNRPNTDAHIELEAELSFCNLIENVLGKSGNKIFEFPIDGCVFIPPETRGSSKPELIKGLQPNRIRDLDDIPSPYLNGILDSFFDGRLTPFLETNRGCPFRCTFCHTGNDFFQKINKFSMERIKEEISYIASRVSNPGIVNLHIADTNFGMYERDREVTEALRKAHDQFGWPMQIMATTGKNNKARVIDITSVLGSMFSVNMSVQSMDETVLKNIKRSNIKLEDYMDVNKHLRNEGRSTKGELILPLPGETKESFTKGLMSIIDGGVSGIGIYTLMMLHGTEFQNPEYINEYKIKGKFRIVPLNFGQYGGGDIVLDYEEAAVETKDMSFQEYLDLRRLALLVETLHNGRPFEEFFRYMIDNGISRSQFLLEIYNNISNAPEDIKQISDDFTSETKGELWDSESELIKHYNVSENYEKLLQGKVGGNLIYKYKSNNLVYAHKSWIKFLSLMCKNMVKSIASNKEINTISQFCNNRLNGLLDKTADTSPIFMQTNYNVVAWFKSDESNKLSDFSIDGSPIVYKFYYSQDQLKVRSDQFKRYGTDINALSKIVTRVSNIESLTRKVAVNQKDKDIFSGVDQDLFVRYSLSN